MKNILLPWFFQFDDNQMIIILCGHRDQTHSSRIFLSVPLKNIGNNRTRSQRELRWILIRPELATCEECFHIPGSYYMRMGDELGWVHALNAVGLRRAWVNGMRLLLYTYTPSEWDVFFGRESRKGRKSQATLKSSAGHDRDSWGRAESAASFVRSIYGGSGTQTVLWRRTSVVYFCDDVSLLPFSSSIHPGLSDSHPS